MTGYRVAVIPGDGIGKEVMPEGIRTLDAAAECFGIELDFLNLDWACGEYYEAHGRMMPEDWKAQLAGIDAVLFGAVGWPDTVPDHVSLWGSLLQFRRGFDQYINLRPARTFDGVASPLVDAHERDIDFVVIRENTEGEYCSVGGAMFEGTGREVVMQQSVFSRFGTERFIDFAFRFAAGRPRRHLTLATKSNGVPHSMPWWDARAEEVARHHPAVEWDKQHIDILCARFVQQPERFDVIAASNLFGDILSDLGPACTGTIGLAPSANLNPERTYPSLFEPVHGSAPDIYGQNIANPVAMIWSGAMMLDFLGAGSGAGHAAHNAILTAIEQVLAKGPHTPDMGSVATTQQVGESIARLIVEGETV